VSTAPVANVFLGTSAFASEVLSALAGSQHRPLLVVAPPDRARGRGRRLSPPPVATAARELDLPLHQTRSVNEPGSTATLLAAGAEVGCVCAFGQLIAEPLLSGLPMLNVHPSLLPRWRGAAPIERAIMAGDGRTGVCIMRLTEGLDSGPLALSAERPVGEGESYGELAAELATLGGELLIRALDLHSEDSLELTEQATEGITYAEKIVPEDRRLDPSRPAIELQRIIRALTPHIGAFLELSDGGRLGVRAGAVAAGGLEPGELAERSGLLLLGCGEGVLAISELQPPGKRAMAAADWLRGHPLPAGLRAG
jgi:methionyl-tRNA formyltransferase